MKSLKLLSIALLTSGSVLAQHQSPFLKNQLPNNNRQHQVLQMLLPQDAGSTAQKSTGTRKRLIAQSSYTSGTLTDTAKYFYSNNYQASKYDFNQMDYDNSSYNPVDYPVFSYMSGLLGSGSFSLGANCDSFRSWSDDGSGSGLLLSENQHNGFVNNNHLSTYNDMSYYNGDTYGKRYTNSYDGQARLVSSIQQSYDTASNSWDTVNKKALTYNAQSRVQTDTVYSYDAGSWVATTAYSYTYDANGNITQINDYEFNGANWTLEAQYQNTYNANRLKIMTYLADTSGGGGLLAPVTIDSFGYTGSSNMYTYWTENYIVGPSFSIPILQFSRTLNSMGLPDSLNISAFNGSSLSPVQSGRLSYDADGNPLSVSFHDLQNSTDGVATYYYETFNDATSVGNVPAATQLYTVFPNPAQEVLNIRAKGNIAAATARIVNTLGQTVFSGQLENASNQKINIGNLQSGVYWITIADADGKSVSTQSFVKQ